MSEHSSGSVARDPSPQEVVTDRIEQATDISLGEQAEMEVMEGRSRSNAVENDGGPFAGAKELASRLIQQDRVEQARIDANKQYVQEMQNRVNAAEHVKQRTTGVAAGVTQANAVKYGVKAGAAVADHFAAVPLMGFKPAAAAVAAVTIKDTIQSLGHLDAIGKQENLSAEQAKMVDYMKRQQHGKLKNAGLSVHVATSTPNTVHNTANYLFKKIMGTQGKAREECATKLINGLQNGDDVSLALVCALDGKKPNRTLTIVQNLKNAPPEYGKAYFKGKLAK